MKRLIALAVLGMAFATSANAADNDFKTVPITGNVANLCVLGTPSAASVALGGLVNTSGAAVGHLTTITNQTVTLPGSFCNFANSIVTVSATALTAADASAVQTGFARAVNFTATASNWTPTATAATTVASAQGNTPTSTTAGATLATPKLADISLVLSAFTAPGGNLLVAGNYSGSVTVTLAPSVAN